MPAVQKQRTPRIHHGHHVSAAGAVAVEWLAATIWGPAVQKQRPTPRCSVRPTVLAQLEVAPSNMPVRMPLTWPHRKRVRWPVVALTLPTTPLMPPNSVAPWFAIAAWANTLAAAAVVAAEATAGLRRVVAVQIAGAAAANGQQRPASVAARMPQTPRMPLTALAAAAALRRPLSRPPVVVCWPVVVPSRSRTSLKTPTVETHRFLLTKRTDVSALGIHVICVCST